MLLYLYIDKIQVFLNRVLQAILIRVYWKNCTAIRNGLLIFLLFFRGGFWPVLYYYWSLSFFCFIQDGGWKYFSFGLRRNSITVYNKFWTHFTSHILELNRFLRYFARFIIDGMVRFSCIPFRHAVGSFRCRLYNALWIFVTPFILRALRCCSVTETLFTLHAFYSQFIVFRLVWSRQLS